MTKEQGLKEIREAKWVKDKYEWFSLTVTDELDRPVVAQLSLRPEYCDRGHFQLQMDGHLHLDGADSFPRFFFSVQEADHHVRSFLRWRLWKERTYPHSLDSILNLNKTPPKYDYPGALELWELAGKEDIKP